jgi:methylated-DNA-[protein]-cysteine S-methyltransferase
MQTTRISTPMGPLHVAAHAGAIVGLRFEAFEAHDHAGAATDESAVLARAKDAVGAYLAGDLDTFARLPLAPRGTPFETRVWEALRAIPAGETTTYGALAAALGRPTAARAVGAANGKNPIAIAIPCHRVIGKSGALTGYAWGLERKEWLLSHEKRAVA